MHHPSLVCYTTKIISLCSFLVAAPPPAAPPAQKIDAPAQVPKTPLIRKQVLKPSHSSPLRSALDTVASDGAITNALTTAAEVGASQIPELFRSVMPSHPPSALAKAESVQSGTRSMFSIPGHFFVLNTELACWAKSMKDMIAHVLCSRALLSLLQRL